MDKFMQCHNVYQISTITLYTINGNAIFPCSLEMYLWLNTSFFVLAAGSCSYSGEILPRPSGLPWISAGEWEVAPTDFLQTDVPQLTECQLHGTHPETDWQTQGKLTCFFFHHDYCYKFGVMHHVIYCLSSPCHPVLGIPTGWWKLSNWGEVE